MLDFDWILGLFLFSEFCSKVDKKYYSGWAAGGQPGGWIIWKQAGAELGQAQPQLGLGSIWVGLIFTYSDLALAKILSKLFNKILSKLFNKICLWWLIILAAKNHCSDVVENGLDFFGYVEINEV